MIGRALLFVLIFGISPVLAKENQSTKVLLSLDGGGTRVVGTIAILREIFKALEAELGRPVKVEEVIDLIGGTSAGGIVALMLASGKTPQQSLDLFIKHAPAIFSVDWVRWLMSANCLLGAKYPTKGFEKILKQTFGDESITDVKIPVFVTTYCRNVDEFKLLDSEDSKEFPGLTKVQAALATSAPPTYFSRQTLNSIKGKLSCEDGGVGANDPGELVLTKARHNPQYMMMKMAKTMPPAQTYILISIGTGKDMLPAIDEDAGIVGFAKGAVREFISATRAATELQLRTELGKENYYRFQFMSQEPLDTTDSVILKGIIEKGEAVSKTEEFKSLVKKLAQVIRSREAH